MLSFIFSCCLCDDNDMGRQAAVLLFLPSPPCPEAAAGRGKSHISIEPGTKVIEPVDFAQEIFSIPSCDLRVSNVHHVILDGIRIYLTTLF